jgi:hypothetical protein
VLPGRAGHIGRQRPAAHIGHAGSRIDRDAAQLAQVHDHAAVRERGTAPAVAAAADRQRDVQVARGSYGGRDLLGGGAADDGGGPAVDRAVPQAARAVVAGSARVHASGGRCRLQAPGDAFGAGVRSRGHGLSLPTSASEAPLCVDILIWW